MQVRDKGTGKMEMGEVGSIAAALHTWAKMRQKLRDWGKKDISEFSAQILRSPFIVVDK